MNDIEGRRRGDHRPVFTPAEHAWSAETKVLALDIDDREALLRAMEDWCPPDLGELRAVLLQEHVGRVRDGLV